MNNILIMPGDKDHISLLDNSNIKGVILHIKDFSRGSNITYTKEEVNDIVNKYLSKEISICINKIFMGDDIESLKELLLYFKDINISKIYFYDMAVYELNRELNINKELVIYQEHLNASIYSNNYYNKRGINYSFITNDITYKEINDVINNTNMNIILEVYGYIPMFSSKRNLVKSYFDYINQDKTNDIYYLNHDDDMYPILEEVDGTTIYTKKINLMPYLDKLDNIKYLVINGFNLDDKEILDVIEGKTYSDYSGFINEETIYKVGGNK